MSGVQDLHFFHLVSYSMVLNYYHDDANNKLISIITMFSRALVILSNTSFIRWPFTGLTFSFIVAI